MSKANILANSLDCNTNPLSAQQNEALNAILFWYQLSDEPAFHLAGYAGTGKTELVVRLQQEIEAVQFAAFTGKAASVLRHRGAENAITLHSLLYGPPIVQRSKNGDDHFIWLRKTGKLPANLIVADECSQID